MRLVSFSFKHLTSFPSVSRLIPAPLPTSGASAGCSCEPSSSVGASLIEESLVLFSSDVIEINEQIAASLLSALS